MYQLLNQTFCRAVLYDCRGLFVVQVSSEYGFRFLNLDPGSYAIRCEMEGFKTREIKDIPIRPNSDTRVEIVMESDSSNGYDHSPSHALM